MWQGAAHGDLHRGYSALRPGGLLDFRGRPGLGAGQGPVRPACARHAPLLPERAACGSARGRHHECRSTRSRGPQLRGPRLGVGASSRVGACPAWPRRATLGHRTDAGRSCHVCGPRAAGRARGVGGQALVERLPSTPPTSRSSCADSAATSSSSPRFSPPAASSPPRSTPWPETSRSSSSPMPSATTTARCTRRPSLRSPAAPARSSLPPASSKRSSDSNRSRIGRGWPVAGRRVSPSLTRSPDDSGR